MDLNYRIVFYKGRLEKMFTFTELDTNWEWDIKGIF